jgi:hypothetical protein
MGDELVDPQKLQRRRAMLEVVENQLRDGSPPETQETLDRLLAEGHSREQAVELIACVLAAEIFDMLKHRQPYDEARYLAGLRALPRLAWESDKGQPRTRHGSRRKRG